MKHLTFCRLMPISETVYPTFVRPSPPDVLLIEVATNSSSTLRVPANLLASVPHVRILFISTNENATYVRTVFATGVLGYILKSAAQSELCSGSQANLTEAGDLLILGSKIPSSKVLPCPDSSRPTECLSGREIEVLRAVALGFTFREIWE